MLKPGTFLQLFIQPTGTPGQRTKTKTVPSNSGYMAIIILFKQVVRAGGRINWFMILAKRELSTLIISDCANSYLITLAVCLTYE
jgi:hypothetical protein